MARGEPPTRDRSGSDHPLILEPHMVLNLLLDECIDNTHLVIKEKRKKKRNDQKKLQQAIESRRKPKNKIT
jgi:hypothetical protein